jgi:polyhydroxyalkanoate synthesis regulator phasin
MTHRPDNHTWRNGGARLIGRLDKMVQAGRLTEEDAERLRAAANSGQLDDAIREIQLKHARERVNTALENGRLGQEEARAIFDRLAKGEDPRFLRGLLHGIETDG